MANTSHGAGNVFNMPHLWRVLATGFSFVAIGVGGPIMAVLFFPLLAIVTRNPYIRQLRVQYVIHAGFRLYVGMMRFLGLFDLHIVDDNVLRSAKGCLIIANHPTLLDVVLIMSLQPNMQCVVKKELWRNPFLWPVVASAGYIRNDTDPERWLQQCTTALEQGSNLLIFPEGTRSKPGLPMRLNRGFALVALRAKARILPLTIRCTPLVLTKGAPWHSVPDIKPRFTIEVGEVFEALPFMVHQQPVRDSRLLTAHVHSYYMAKLNDDIHRV